MSDYFTWETETYPRLWRLAYDAGTEAKMQGHPRDCNLKDLPWTTPSGQILKVYKSAWEQGWDQFEVPSIFKDMESVLQTMPLKEIEIALP